MGRLSSDSQEKFANYLANGYTQMAAYKEAGYSCKNATADANANHLANSPKIKQRVEELKLLRAEKEALSTAPPLPVAKQKISEIDLEWINREYITLLNKAKEIEDLKNAVAIVKEMAELNQVKPALDVNNETNRNRMLPSNDKPNMGNTINISLIDPKSAKDGGGFNGPLAITIPDAESVFVGDYTTDENE